MYNIKTNYIKIDYTLLNAYIVKSNYFIFTYLLYILNWNISIVYIRKIPSNKHRRGLVDSLANIFRKLQLVDWQTSFVVRPDYVMLISSLIFTMKIVIPMRLLGECHQDCKMVKTIPRYWYIIKQLEES